MERKLDITKVNDALKRAAQAAISGSREERAGRITSRSTRTGPTAPKKAQPKKGSTVSANPSRGKK